MEPNRIHRTVVLLTLAGAVAGCSEQTPEPDPLRPVRSAAVVASQGGRTRTFSGTARAGQETDLSFRVGGTVDLLGVTVGDVVRRDQVIARLDRTDFLIAVRRAQANLDQALATSRNADADLERIRGLWENQNASQSDLDQALAGSQSARASVEVSRQSKAQSERQLGYSTLRSPVDGSIAAVDVEVNENVGQGQTVVRLTSGSQPEVEVAIPGVLISSIERGNPVSVTFNALPGERFEAVVTEVGVAATGTATTFPVTVQLAEGVDDVRSGMAADVAFQFGKDDEGERIFVPAYAVGEDGDGRYVFLLESRHRSRATHRRRGRTGTDPRRTAGGPVGPVRGTAAGHRRCPAPHRRPAGQAAGRRLVAARR
jgi:RND family efflux transporter MFP subunit